MAFFLAWRYLRSKKGGSGFVSIMSLFSFLGILLGVATLIIVLSVMGGFKERLLDKILTFNAHISLYTPGGVWHDYGLTLKTIQEQPYVLRATPLVEDQAVVLSSKQTAGVMVRGVPRDALSSKGVTAQTIVSGSLERFQDGSHTILIGKRLAQKLNVWPGSVIRLMTAQGKPTPFGSVPAQYTLTVAAIYDVGMSEYNMGYVFVPFETAQRIFHMKGGVSAIEVDVRDPESVRQEMLKLRNALNKPDLLSLDWQRRNAAFFEAIMVERNVMFIVLSLIVLIAAFNIVSGMVMMVKDKTKAIGILRAMGATQRFILRVFVLVGASIGVLGTLCGAITGTLFCYNIEGIRKILESVMGGNLFQEEIYYLSKLPAVVNPYEVMTVVSVALGLTFLATLYPAWRAAKMHPQEALRYDG